MGRERRERQIRVAAVYADALVWALPPRLIWPLRWTRRRLGLVERRTYRMPLRAAQLRRAIATGPGLEPFHPWLRVDRHDYRVWPSSLLLARILRRLRGLDADNARRVEAVERLRALQVVAPAVRRGEPQPLFRVPLLTDNRAALVAKLERRVRSVGYIFDPPLDDYAGAAFAEPSPAPDAARSWASHVFPVDPLEADRVIRFMRD
jgi:hypothetical protein